jgi:hypothetical protein
MSKEDEFYCGVDKKLEDNFHEGPTVECNLCGKENLLLRSNNPRPLIHSDDDEDARCCTSCNSYVTSARLMFPKNGDPFEMANMIDGMVSFIRMANSMRRAQEQIDANIKALSD